MGPKLPEAAESRLAALMERYPDRRSAIMPALYLAQEHFGHISDVAVAWVAERIGLPPVHVMEVATFYTMYYKKPVGKYHVQVCRTLPCALRGAGCLTSHLRERLGVGPHEVTEDSLWSYEEVECLGSCGTGPMCEINDTYLEDLTAQRLDELMTRIEREHPELRLSASRDTMTEGFACDRNIED